MNAATNLVKSLLEDETDMSDPVERREVQIARELSAMLASFSARCPELNDLPQAGTAPTVDDAQALCAELANIHGQ